MSEDAATSSLDLLATPTSDALGPPTPLDNSQSVDILERVDPTGDSDDDQLSPKQLLMSLLSLWKNEKLCPELLPIQDSVVEAVNDVLAHLQPQKSRDVRGSLHRLEHSRMLYLVKDYQRVRLRKLQELALATIADEKLLLSWMSREERQYFMDHRRLVQSHFENSVLNRLPGDFKRLPLINEEETTTSNGRTVFVVVGGDDKETDESLTVTLDDDEEAVRSSEVNVTLKSGTQHVLPYETVREQLLQGKLNLL